MPDNRRTPETPEEIAAKKKVAVKQRILELANIGVKMPLYRWTYEIQQSAGFITKDTVFECFRELETDGSLRPGILS